MGTRSYPEGGTPALKELFSAMRDDRKRKARETAIIIPSNRRSAILERHIKTLGHQARKDFDIIIIYGMEDDFVTTPPWASILHLRRSRDFGSAGSFCAGEMIAVREGYSKIILADDDCMPESEDLLIKLSAALERSHMAKPLLLLPPRKNPMETVLHQYGAIRKEAFEEAGYSYLPLYSGCEDLELEERLRSRFGRAQIVDAYASHPWFIPPILCGAYPYKAHNFGQGCAAFRHVLGRHPGAFLDLFFRGLKTSACLAIGRADISSRYIECTVREYSLLLGLARSAWQDKAMVEIPKQYREEPVDLRSIDRVFLYEDFQCEARAYDNGVEIIPLSFKDRKDDEKIHGMATSLGNLGKRVAFEGWFSEWDLKHAIFSKRTAIGQGKEIHWVTSERPLPTIALGLVFMAAMIPVSLAIAGALATVGAVNQITRAEPNWGYGTKGRL